MNLTVKVFTPEAVEDAETEAAALAARAAAEAALAAAAAARGVHNQPNLKRQQ